MAKYKAKNGVGIIPKGATEIEDCAFDYCKNLTSINIPNSVTEIGKYAFEVCIALKNVVIPDSVTEIKKDTFKGRLSDCRESIGKQ